MYTNPLLSLTREHEIFLDFLKLRITSPSQFYDLNRWKVLAILLEKFHHEKEECLLFPSLINTDALKAGGVKCATFFTPRVLSAGGWPDSYHELAKKLEISAAAFLPSTSFREIVFTQKNMLSIPIEDHILGAAAIKKIIDKNGDHQTMDLFSHLLKDHIEREEDCLYPLCEKRLTEEQKTNFMEQTKDFDTKNQVNNLLEKLMAP